MTYTMFDRWASSYDRSALQPAYRSAHGAVLDRARRLASAPRIVLDVGCGTGHLLRDAVEAFPSAMLVGVDPSAHMLAVAAIGDAGADRLRRIRATAERLPFADGTFDLALSTASWRHWTDQVMGVLEIARVLAPGGLVGFADVVTYKRTRVVGRRRHRLPVTLTNALASAGLRPMRVEVADGYGPVCAVSIILARHAAY